MIDDGQASSAESPREPYDLTTVRADYPIRDGVPDRTIVICSHPRSGSTLLGEALCTAGGLGCPLEYLHRGFRPYFAGRWEASELAPFVRAMHRFRTDTTGVFSIKLFWRDVEEVVAEAGGFDSTQFLTQDATPVGPDFERMFDVVGTILPNPTFVYLTRRDRVRQAISGFIAGQTKVFRAFGRDDSKLHPVVYEYEAILRQLAAADYSNARWRAFFSASGIDPYPIAYEELETRYDAVVGSLLAHLGHAGRPAAPRLRRQATAQTEEFSLRFLRDHEAAAAR